MKTYARQGGSSSIFINDDGLQLLPAPDRDARIAFYANHGIGYVARPPHKDAQGGFKRAGRFKKASNMNYGLRLSLRLEKHLAVLREREKNEPGSTVGIPRARVFSSSSNVESGSGSGSAEDEDMSLEDRALLMAIEEEYDQGGRLHKPWAANGKAIRMGEIVLIVDSDTVVPEVSFSAADYFSVLANAMVSLGLFP